jgi:peptidyl-prolyl cis-trans isomerase D
MPTPSVKNQRHVAHLEQVRRQTKAIQIGSIVIIVLVALIVIYGFVIAPLIKQMSPVANVNGDNVSVARFQIEVKIQRLQLINQYQQYLQYAQMFGITDLANDQNFGPAIQQIQQQLDPQTSGRAGLDAVIDDQLIRQEAKRRNIVVSADEVEKEVQAGVGYFPKGSPTPTNTSAPVVEPTLNATQLALVTATPIGGPSSPTPTITATLDPSITPTITSTPTATETTGPTVTPLATATALPTATEITADGYKDLLKKQLEGLNSAAKLSENDFRTYYESILYRQKVEDVITADLKPEQEQVWARHILVATEDEAKKVLDRLKKGEDFGALAQELSTDTGSGAKGGDLGWFATGAMVEEFQTAAFALKVGEISQPVKSSFGYHIIQVLGHENRQLDADAFKKFKDQSFVDFLKKLRDSSKVQEFDIWKDVIPTEPALPAAQPQQQQ